MNTKRLLGTINVLPLLVLGFGILVCGNGFAQTSLTVAGQVEATSVKIKDWTLEAPDYVFAPEYRRGDLDSVRTYIEKNHHLPGVPSAKEIKEEGFDLTKMNFKLLEKIEELTLVVIEQERRIKDLESRKKE